jgi:hypothetical protein
MRCEVEYRIRPDGTFLQRLRFDCCGKQFCTNVPHVELIFGEAPPYSILSGMKT